MMNILLWPFKMTLRLVTFGWYNPWKSKIVSDMDGKTYYNPPLYLIPGADYKAAKKIWQKVFGKSGENFITELDGMDVTDWIEAHGNNVLGADLSDFDTWLDNMYYDHGCCGSLQMTQLVLEIQMINTLTSSGLFGISESRDLERYNVSNRIVERLEEERIEESIDDHWDEFLSERFNGQDTGCDNCNKNFSDILDKRGNCTNCGNKVASSGWSERKYTVWYREKYLTPS